jgi:hypothetical protein
MEHAKLKKVTIISLTLKKIVESRARWAALIIFVMIGSVLLAAVVRAYNHWTPNGVSVNKPLTALPLRGASVPTGAAARGNPNSKLSLQPEADRLRRRLGQRFVSLGKEQSVLVGTLTISNQQSQVRITRTRSDDYEQVEIVLNGKLGSLTWSVKDGAKSAGGNATGTERLLIERLALDSPDQFILAQLRGAAYYTVARAARPEGVGASDTYNGPVWDVVQVSEPTHSLTVTPLSGWRLYQINVATGLIDKVVSQEQHGQDLTAEITSWVTQGGETVPSHITWKQGTQTLMELTLSGAAFGPLQ